MALAASRFIAFPMQSGATGTGNGTAMSCLDTSDGAYGTLRAQIVGITSATITWEGTIDGTNFVSIPAINTTTGVVATTATADGVYLLSVFGFNSVRARISGYVSGTITVTGVLCALPVGNNATTSLVASEFHLGEVAGNGKVVKVALTVTANAYSAGNSIGGKITIANAVRVSGGVSILTSIQILDRANQKPTGTIYLFDADPTNATLTDKSAFVFSTDDLKVVAQIPVTTSDYVTTNSKASANLSALAREVQAASGTTLYAAFVTTSTPTFAATTDMQMVFGFVYVN